MATQGNEYALFVNNFFLPVACQSAAGQVKNFYYAFASYVRRQGHLYEIFLLLAKTHLI